LQKLALTPNSSSLNIAFTKHITNALIKIRDEKLKLKASVPKKLEDGWEPIIDMHVNGYDCHASCPIILGRTFLRTVGAIIDMREDTIKYQFPLKKGMEHFPKKRKKFLFDSILRAN
jgi:hypothetical protein